MTAVSKRTLLSSTTCLSALMLMLANTSALANPEDGVVSAGSATISSSGSTLNIYQSTDRAVIDWRGFNISQGETTVFHQPGSGSVTLNRVNSSSPSFINGNLIANGNIFIINQNGILFGEHSRVDVNGLVATSANIDDSRFMNGDFRFDRPGNPNAIIENRGQITAGEAGLVGLVAPNVLNSGTITAKLGRVHLASGDRATVDLYGDGLMEVSVSDDVNAQLVQNTGRITAEGGTIALTAAAGSHIVNNLIRVSGELRAPSVGVRNGKIIIAAEGSNAVKGNKASDKGRKTGKSTVLVQNAVLDVSGRNEGERGGTLSITGDNVALLSGTRIDASGYQGLSDTTINGNLSDVRTGAAGGDIRIGGDYLGQGVTPTALNLYVDPDVLVLNDSLYEGDAGRTIFWSDDTTSFYGNVYARALGGLPVDPLTWHAISNSLVMPNQRRRGMGGFVETSGHGHLDAGGYVDLTSSNGDRGTYFLDPTDITIYGNVDPTFVSTDTTINLATSLKLWLDASDTANVNLTYNSLGTTATGTSGTNTITVSAATGLAIGARIRLGAAGAVTTASTLGADTYTISNISGTTITLSSNLTTNYTISSVYQGYVSQLRDKSGQNNNAVQTTLGSMPLWVSNGQNGIGVARFDGTDDYIPFTSRITTIRTAFFNINSNGNPAWSPVLGDSTTYDFHGSQIGDYLIDSANSYSSNFIRSGSGYVNGGSVAPSSISNSTSFQNIGLVTTGNVAADSLTRDRNIGARVWNGSYGEVIIYDAALSTNPRNLVEQYQSAKWGIALTPPGTGATEVDKATSADGYSVFTTRYLERLSQSANVSLQATNNINLDFKGDNLSLTSGRDITLTAGNNITSASAGTITTSGAGSILLAAGNNINFANDFDLTANGTGSVTLRANNSIFSSASGDITTNGGSITLNSDRDANGLGRIQLDTGTVLASNGGNIILGGGVTPLSTSSRADATLSEAITLTGVTVTAAGGNISMLGNGSSRGINFNGNNTITTNGNGSLTAIGSSLNSLGISSYVGNSLLEVQNGDLTMMGTGGVDWGLLLGGGSSNIFRSTGSGKLLISGYGGTGVSGHGIANSGMQITGTTGDITVTAVKGTNASSSAYLMTGANIFTGGSGTLTFNNTINGASDLTATAGTMTFNGVLGGSTALGNVTLTSTNSISLPAITTAAGRTVSVNITGAGNSITTTGVIATGALGNISLIADDLILGGNLSGTGTLTLQPLSTNRSIRVNQGAGDFNLSTSELTYLVDGWTGINLGRTDAVSGANLYLNTSTWNDPLTLRSYYTALAGTITGLGNAAFTISSVLGAYSAAPTISTQGGNITITSGYFAQSAGNANITTNGGNFSLANARIDAGFGSPTDVGQFNVNTSGGNITLRGINLNALSTNQYSFDAGAGTLNVTNAINTAANLILSASTITLAQALGVSTALGNVTLTSINNISLPAITTAAGKTVNVNVTGAGSSITTTGAISTGAAGNISFTADDLILGANLSGTGTLTLQPNSTTRAVRVNSGAGDFNLSTAEIAWLSDGWSQINIGNLLTSVDMYVGSTTWIDPVVFRNSFRKTFNGLTGTGNASFTTSGGGWSDLLGDITTAGGNVDFSNAGYLWFGSPGRSITTSGGNISLRQINLGTNGATLNAGAGSISFSNTLTGPNDLTATAATINIGSAWTNTGNITFNSANSISLPSISTVAGKTLAVNVTGAGNSIMTTGPIATGAAGNISLMADDLVLGGNLSGTGSLTLKQSTLDRRIYVNYGSADGTNLNLTTAELAYLVNGWAGITIGASSNGGFIDLGASTFYDPVNFTTKSGGTPIYTHGVLTGADNASITTGSLNATDNITTNGGAITVTGNFSVNGNSAITTNGGQFMVVYQSFLANNTNLSVATGGGNIIFDNSNFGSDNAISGGNASSSVLLNAGAGAINFKGGLGLNTPASMTATAGSMTFVGPWGGSSPLGNVTLNSTNSIALPSITTAAGKTVAVTVSGAGNSITTTGAIATGAAGNITLTADDLVLGGNLSGTGTLKLQPPGNDRTVRVNSGSGDFNLDTTEISYLVNGWGNILIGNGNGGFSDTFVGTSTWHDPVKFQQGYYVHLGSGTITVDDGASLTVAAYQTFLDNLIMNVDGDISIGNSTLFPNATIQSYAGNVSISGIIGGSTLNVIAPNSKAINFTNGASFGTNITASAGTINFDNSTYGTLGAVSLTSLNSLSLPSITATSILARTTGATSDITIGAGKTLTASGAGTAITLASGRNIINAATTPFNLTGGGRWLTYSASLGADTLNGLTSNFVRYSCTYGGACPSVPASGNGFLYSITPVLTVTPGTTNVVYGDAASLTGYGYGVSGYLTLADSTADLLSGSLTGTSTYVQGADIGTYNLDYSSGTLASALGYGFTYGNSSNAVAVGKRTLTTSLTGTVSKEYDGTTTALLNAANYSFGNLYAPDAGLVEITSTAGTYDDKTATTGKTVTVSGLALGGSKSGNYQLASGSTSGSIGVITQKSLSLIGLTGVNRVYDGSTLASLSGTAGFSGLIGGDTVTIDTVGTASFADKNVGTGKTLTVAGYSITGLDAANYLLSQPTGLTANITKATLLVSATGQDKVYDGTTATSVTLSDNRIGGDVLTIGYGSADFNDKNGGLAKTVTVNGITVTNTDAGNYDFNTTTTTTATINKAALTATANPHSVVYGGALTGNGISYTGFISGEDETLLATTPTVTSALSGPVDVGTYVGNYTLSGGTDSNYSFTYNPGTLTVTKAPLVVTAGSQTIIEGAPIPVGTISYSGFAYGQNSSVIDTLATVSSVNTGILPIGTYAGNYVASGAFDTNYSFTYVNGNLLVNPQIPVPPVVQQIPATVEYTSQIPFLNSSVHEFNLGPQGIVLIVSGSESSSQEDGSSTSEAEDEKTASRSASRYTQLSDIVIEISKPLAKMLKIYSSD